MVRNDNNNTVNPLISQPARRVILGSRASPAPLFPVPLQKCTDEYVLGSLNRDRDMNNLSKEVRI